MKVRVEGLLSFPVTPFTAAGEPDLPRYKEHVEYMMSHRPGALFVCGGTGEYFSLGLGEYAALVKAAVDVVGGAVPVISGVGYGTRLARDFAHAAQEAGADGIMVMPPYLLNSEQSGLYAHYKAIADSVQIGVIIYQRDNAIFSPQTAARLAEVSNIVGFKDGHGDVERLFRTRLAVGDRLFFINGMPTAELSAPAFQGAGVRDYSSAVFNFVPEISRAFYEAVISGDQAQVERLMHGFYLPFAELRDRVKGYAVSLIKAGVSMRLGEAGGCRAPLVDPTPEHRAELEAIMQKGLALVR